MPVQLPQLGGVVPWDVEQAFDRLRQHADALEARLAAFEEQPKALTMAEILAALGGMSSSAFLSIFQMPGIVAGPNTAVQFNDGGILGGDAGFTYDKTGQSATVGNQFTAANQMLTANQVVVGPGGIFTDGAVHAVGGVSGLLGLFTPGIVEGKGVEALSVIAKDLVLAPIVRATSEVIALLRVTSGQEGYWERGRGAALGDWVTVPFNAVNYTANSGTWAVEQADVLLSSYTLIGDTAIYAFNVVNSTITTAGNELRIGLPISAASAAYTGVQWISGDNGPAVGFCSTRGTPIANAIALFRPDATNWVNSTNNTSVRGVIAFPLA